MTSHDAGRRPPVRTFKPRRRALAPARAARVERLAARWAIDQNGSAIDPITIFGRVAPLVLDIGIGLGDTMIEMARAQPEFDVIGVDVHTPGFATSLERIDELTLTNVRVVHGDAIEFLDRLRPTSLSGIRIYFPDPWPKIRQRHRRLVRPDLVERLVVALAPGGWVHLATDSDDYVGQMRRVCDACPHLSGGVVTRPDWRPVTRYERRGLALGHDVTDLWYTRAPV